LKKLIFFLILFIYPLTLSLPQTSCPKNIRVMTYNIKFAGDPKSDSINSWQYRKEPVVSVIRFNKADIVGLQEALKIQLDDFTKLLPEYFWIGVGRDDGKTGGEYSAILLRKDRFKILKQSTFWLSETPDKPSMGWDAACIRIVTWAKLFDKVTRKEFFVFNTHLDHMGEVARKNSAILIMEKISGLSSNLPVVLTGDFNSLKDSEPYRIITTSTPKLFDAQFISEHGHYGGNISFNNFSDSLEANNKIDFIFVNDKVKVCQHGIVSEKYDGHYPSDHMPVVADLNYK
jgi:endonuclease/exonuclease/phosphatase family metal-dependent hydrolase